MAIGAQRRCKSKSTMKRGRRAYYLYTPILVLVFTLALLSWYSSGTGVEAFASGLNQPRGMAFDDAGNLYVVEAGMVDAQAEERSSPSTNYSSRVLRIDRNGRLTTFMDGLPFTHYEAAGDVGGTDVQVLAGTVYVLTGEGYDDNLSRSVLRAVPGQRPERVANLLSFAFSTTSSADQMALGAVPSNPYAMTAAPDGTTLYITDGASGSVLSARLDGTMRTFAMVPGMPPLTGLTFGPDGRLYVAMFSALPLARASGAVWAADRDGQLALAVDGLTMPIDVAFDSAGTLYVLEFSDGLGPGEPYAAGTGRLLRIGQNGRRTVVLERLNYPTSMVFSQAGDLYIAVAGAFSAPGQGAILKVPCRALHSLACA